MSVDVVGLLLFGDSTGDFVRGAGIVVVDHVVRGTILDIACEHDPANCDICELRLNEHLMIAILIAIRLYDTVDSIEYCRSVMPIDIQEEREHPRVRGIRGILEESRTADDEQAAAEVSLDIADNIRGILLPLMHSEVDLR